MKYIKEYNSYSDIESVCKQYGIRRYTINSDGSIDVDGNVSLISKRLINLPLNFNKVAGDFNCGINKLTSLKGCPKEVAGGIDCYYNNQLPKLIMDNRKYIKGIIKWQDDYSIWRKDGTLDEFRFNDMMIDIKNDYEI